MAKRRHWIGPIPSDENRCTRNDGKNWRCYAPRSPDSIFCTKHHLNYLSKLRSKNPSSILHHNPKPPKTLTLNPGEIWALSSSSKSKSKSKPKTHHHHHHHFHYFRVDQTLPTLLATTLLPHPVLPEEIQSRHPPSCGTFRPAPSGPKPVSTSAFAFQMFGVKTVTWMRIPFYRIFPSKGEVWAVDGGAMVEVVSDFGEEEGVTVAELAEVEGRGDGVYGRSSEQRVFGRREMVLFLRRVEVERVEGGDGEQQHLWKVMP